MDHNSLGIDTTADIELSKDPLQRVIGQDEAVRLAKIAARQRRHLLLVGPPGIGKSMIALALSMHLHNPTEEIQIVHNPENPQRPFVKIRKYEEIKAEMEKWSDAEGTLVDPRDVPPRIAEKLRFRCPHCKEYSSPDETTCPHCSKPKFQFGGTQNTPFGDLFNGLIQITGAQLGSPTQNNRIKDTITSIDGKEEVVAYERAGERVRILNEKALERERELKKRRPSKVLVPINRNPFVLATGASETELLGDVRHDPYGGHPQLGTPPYERVVAGAIHEAHEGVLFVDELQQLGHMQRYILTAMQNKAFSISGRNPQSAGASVRVDNVPCDFIFVGACNIQDLPHILSPLRSRIIGSGYEILLNTVMPYNEENILKYAQFVAQEITIDGRIPHATAEAVWEIVKEGKKRARDIDGKKSSLTLRFRDLGGVIRCAGDIAVEESAELIEKTHVRRAVKISRSAEEQIKSKYGSFKAALKYDLSNSQQESAGYNYWNTTETDDKMGYE